MKKSIDLTKLTVDELVDRFGEICWAQSLAIEKAKTKKFTALYWQMDAVDKELRARGPEARRALMRLYDHPSMQVQLMAARLTLGVAPVEARAKLQEIADSKWPPQAWEATATVYALDHGDPVPT